LLYLLSPIQLKLVELVAVDALVPLELVKFVV
jgi:hypothetical protein